MGRDMGAYTDISLPQPTVQRRDLIVMAIVDSVGPVQYLTHG